MHKHVGVYRIRNLLNGKVYIGQGTDIYQRWRQHRHRLEQGSHHNRHLQAAWKHHGAAAFVFEIVLECAVDQLGTEEVATLAAIPLDMQYNLGVAGYNPTLGMKKRRASKLQQSRSKGGRPFFRKNLATGETVRFDFTSDAAPDRPTRNAINQCVSGRRPSRTHRGFAYWSDPDFVPVPFVKPQKVVEKRNREVVGTNNATGAELRFPYVAAVVKAGFQRTGVIKCLSGEMQNHSGHTWRYADGLPHVTMSAEARAKLKVGARVRGGSRAVVGTHVETGAVVRFPYVKAAADAVGVTAPLIHHALAGKMTSAGGYTWAFDVIA